MRGSQRQLGHTVKLLRPNLTYTVSNMFMTVDSIVPLLAYSLAQNHTTVLDVPALPERFRVLQVVFRVPRTTFSPIFAHERLRRVQRCRILSPSTRRSASLAIDGVWRSHRRLVARASDTTEASVDLRSGCFDPPVPARAASFTVSSRHATPATARSDRRQFPRTSQRHRVSRICPYSQIVALVRSLKVKADVEFTTRSRLLASLEQKLSIDAIFFLSHTDALIDVRSSVKVKSFLENDPSNALAGSESKGIGRYTFSQPWRHQTRWEIEDTSEALRRVGGWAWEFDENSCRILRQTTMDWMFASSTSVFPIVRTNSE